MNKKDFDNCSTIIVGKNASRTGRVLMSHNEDDMNCVVQIHHVPRMNHKEDEFLVFDDADGAIPKVSETLAYTWSEFRSPNGESFADGFMNECGVAVVSNGCGGSKISENEPVLKGVGAGFRRIIAERATSARHGVEIAAELMEKYGYRSSRSYAIVDKDEGWFLQVTTGSNFAARRVDDDCVSYIPNWYTIHQIDFSDTEHKNFYWSKDLVSYAERNGWYTPAKAGDYSDFDFAKVYQDGGVEVKSNFDRSDLAWSQLRAKQPYTTFQIKAEKKYTVADLKKIMRSHYMEYEEDLKTDSRMSPHRYGLCRDTTVESIVVEFNDVPRLTCVWRAFPRPCANIYTPWYAGIDRVNPAYEWVDGVNAQRSHLSPDKADFEYKDNKAYWAFFTLQNIMEYDYQFCRPIVAAEIAKVERQLEVSKAEVDKAYAALAKINERYAVDMLTDYTAQQAEKTFRWAQKTAQKLLTEKDKRNMDFWRSKL